MQCQVAVHTPTEVSLYGCLQELLHGNGNRYPKDGWMDGGEVERRGEEEEEARMGTLQNNNVMSA